MKRVWTLSVLFAAFPALVFPNPWSASYVSDTLPAAIQVGAKQTVTITYKNEGTNSWDGVTRLATSGPRDRNSPFYTEGNWIAPHRVRGVDAATDPGANGTYTFDVSALAPPGHYLENFEMLQEMVSWFEGTGDNFRWRVNVCPGGQIHLEAENYDNAGPGVGYHDTTPGNSGGAYRSDDVDIEACAEGGFNVTSIADGEWLRYSNLHSAGGLHAIAVRVASTNANGTFYIEVNGQNVTGTVQVPNTGGGQVWTTVDAGEHDFDDGLNTVRFVAVTGGFKVNWIQFNEIETRHTADPDDFFPRRNEIGDQVELAMRIGTLEDQYQTIGIPSGHYVGGALSAVQIGDSLLIRFVIPDDLEGHHYHIGVRIAGTLVHERSGTTRGFGPRSLFVPLGETARALTEGADGISSNLRVENLASQPLHLESVTLLSEFDSWVAQPMPDDDFLLSFLTTEFFDPEGPWYVDLTPIGQLNTASPIRKALSMEIHYPNRWAALMQSTAQQIATICNDMNLDFLPVLASWWMGTPGLAGHPYNIRENIELQQICWSDSDTYDEANLDGYLGTLGQNLKTLLGDRWDLRYGLTIPNMWSDTPWPTMNHAGLNTWRHSQLQEAIGIYEQHLAGRIVGYVAENEPAYWAWPGANPTYPVQRDPLWADFNPNTVADALEDGVYLDPSNGLDLLERAWFHLNLARYNENTIAAILAAQPTRRTYSHVLLGYDYFPFQGTGRARPYADPGRVSNGRLGVEMLWGTDMDSLWRLREWGKWGCINREELDSWGIQYHLATLRANYALGSDSLNSYNWHSMRDHIEGNPVVYFNTFIDEVAAGARMTLATRTAGSTWLDAHNRQENLPANAAFPWFNRIELQLQATGGVQTPLEVKITRQSDGAIVAHRLIHPAEVQSGLAPYDFGDLAWLLQGDQVTLRLQGATGWQALGHSTQGVNFRLVCDMNKERHRSHYVIGERDGTEAAPVPMTMSSNVEGWQLF